ncbi:hypothetical protein BRYFOR_07309 [Marvinbryantia formatexigens DSM 14469]|uniref:Uncharacterized protein n=1 Tax=Marvinbryantia formatexigens DSM 14469 TaxID=478749 RepID=C6LFA7_9FIRM|nr:hypothetical protein BRYFOR_07309 [Marvinbryantia formatexigens DSM 14469]
MAQVIFVLYEKEGIALSPGEMILRYFFCCENKWMYNIFQKKI